MYQCLTICEGDISSRLPYLWSSLSSSRSYFSRILSSYFNFCSLRFLHETTTCLDTETLTHSARLLRACTSHARCLNGSVVPYLSAD